MLLPSHPALFGKVPVRGDFVRIGPASRALDAFDDWAQRGFARGRPRVGEDAVYRTFFAAPDGSEAFVGAVRMSRDAVGRTYPLLAGRTVALSGAPPQFTEWPVEWAASFDAAAALVRQASDGLVDAGRLEAETRRLPAPSRSDEQSALGWDRAARAAPAAALWAALWGEEAPHRAAGLVARLAAAVEGGAPGYGLRFPLPSGGMAGAPSPAQRAAAVAAWLRLAAALHGAPPPAPWVFWTDPPPRTAPGRPAPVSALPPRPPALTLFLVPPAGLAFLPLFGRADDREALLDLDGDDPGSVRALPPSRAALLQDAQVSFDALLHRL